MTEEVALPCLILAGGLSRRMGGGAKFLKELKGTSLLDRVIHRVRPQVGEMLLSCNMSIESIDIPSRPDVIEGYHGPLAGILTGLEYFIEQGSVSTHMLSTPADAPFVPHDLVERLRKGLSSSRKSIVMAYSKERIHPVVALWPLALAKDLRTALEDEGLRKILIFAERYSLTSVTWSDEEGDPFFNINRPEDLAEAEKKVSRF